ncbi:Uncharacterised protein [Neisseria sicca]|nr:Uncharacterised protein [Neisseria sicca]
MRTDGFGNFVQLGNIDCIIIFSTVLHIADSGRSSGLRIGRIQCGNGYIACVFRVVVNMFERYGFHVRTRSHSYFTSQNSAVCTHIRERRIIIDGRQCADTQVCHCFLQLLQIDRVAGSIAFGNIGNLVAIHVQAALSGNFADEFRIINGIDADGCAVLTQGYIFARFQRNGRTAGNVLQCMVFRYTVGISSFRCCQFERFVRISIQLTDSPIDGILTCTADVSRCQAAICTN